MGGLLALSYYFRNQKKVRALILVGTRAKARKDLSNLIGRARSSEYRKILRETVVNSFSRSSVADKAQVLHSAIRATEETVLHSLEAFQGVDFSRRLHRISVPTLIIFGREDRITGINEALYLNRKIRTSKLRIIDDAGHLPMMEQSKEFNAEVERFLNSL